tara:strand:+ start:385 stop:585 length:201 start_codon:yes stop_codon:yes gene_type:complete
MTYHYRPTQISDFKRLENILKELEAIVEREDKRHLMDQHLMIGSLDVLNDEIIPLIDEIVNYDPTP